MAGEHESHGDGTDAVECRDVTPDGSTPTPAGSTDWRRSHVMPSRLALNAKTIVAGQTSKSPDTGVSGDFSSQGYFVRAMYLVSRYSSMPSVPPSRPKPDSLIPPNGAAASEMTPRLMPTMPDWMPSATRNARSSDCV